MRQLSDILIERIEQVGGKAKLGRMLGVTGEAILQYTQGTMPNFKVALKWKEVFDENIIDLMFPDEKESLDQTLSMVSDLEAGYKATKKMDNYTKALEELNECRKEKEQVVKELAELKNFQNAGAGRELKTEKAKK